MPSLILSNNSASNPQTLDLSNYLRLQPDQGADPADPAFSEKVWGRSILREGATLALEQVTEKELLFPLALKGTTASVVSGTLVQQINQIITTAGATASWQDDGMSQPTVFDLLSGQVDIEYSYFRGKQAWCNCKMRLFTQPYGHPAAPRPYAAASGVGPLLVISPYASGGGQVIGASTQAGVAGYGGVKQGGVPSGGVFYWGSPSLAGDAPAMLQISYVGPLPTGATDVGLIPTVAISILPDALYRPLITAQEIQGSATAAGASEHVITATTSVGGAYRQMWVPNTNRGANWTFSPIPNVPSYALSEPAIGYAGQHRLIAIARASGSGTASVAGLYQFNPLGAQSAASAALPLGGDWAAYDLGTVAMRASEMPVTPVVITSQVYGGPQAVDIAAVVMLPDSSTWFFNSKNSVNASQYGMPSSSPFALPQGGAFAAAPYTNTLLIDDVAGDQFVFSGASMTFAPSPIGAIPSSARVSQFTRGLVPRPEPRNGLPIVAIFAMAQTAVSSVVGPVGASWANPQNLRTLAQVNVLERTRYVLN